MYWWKQLSRYKKGADAERELIHALYDKGFSVVRVAGSGSTSLPAPDIVALSREKKLAFECKAWRGDYVNIPADQMNELISWSERAAADIFVAWKVPNKGWLFLTPEMFNKSPKAFSISKKHAFKNALDFNVILGHQAQIKQKLKR